MAGNYVFPGGMLDPGDGDRDVWMQRVDMGVDAIRDRFGQETLDLVEVLRLLC